MVVRCSTGDMFHLPVDTGKSASLLYSGKRGDEYVCYRLDDGALPSAAEKMHCFDTDDMQFIPRFKAVEAPLRERQEQNKEQTKELIKYARRRGSILLQQYTQHHLAEHVQKSGIPRDLDEVSIDSVTVSEDVHEQKGGTCYAHAVATAVRAVEGRIVGRKPQSFDTMKQSIVRKHGKDGGDTFKVLQELCQARNLGCEQIEKAEVLDSLERNRVVVASFELAEYQYDLLNMFIDKQTSRVLTKSDMLFNREMDFPPKIREKEGHAIVITGVNAGNEKNNPVYKIKNSWGPDWGLDGYFHIEADCLAFKKIIDVFFRVSDLISADIHGYLNQCLNSSKHITVLDGTISVKGCKSHFELVKTRCDLGNGRLTPANQTALEKLHSVFDKKDDITVNKKKEIAVRNSKHRFRIVLQDDEESTESGSNSSSDSN